MKLSLLSILPSKLCTDGLEGLQEPSMSALRVKQTSGLLLLLLLLLFPQAQLWFDTDKSLQRVLN